MARSLEELGSMIEKYGGKKPNLFGVGARDELNKATRRALDNGGDLRAINEDREYFGLPPLAEDPIKVAERTAKSQNEATDRTTAANRPDIHTSWADYIWNDAHDDLTVNLSPAQQAALDAQQRLQQGRSEFAQSLLGGAQQAFSSPLNYGALPALPDAEATRGQAIDASFNQARSRLDPILGQRADTLRSSLLNSGFSESDQGYRNAMGDFERDRNDAYNTAMNSAIGSGAQAAQQMFGMGMGQRQQALSEAMQQREMPLNELNAMLHGQQVSMPGQPGVSQASPFRGTDYSGAANTAYEQGMDAYSLEQAKQQAQMNGWMSLLGGLGKMAGGFL